MEYSFAPIMSFVKQQEGGFVDNPNDPGGATKYGVTLDAYSAFMRRKLTVEDIKNLSWENAQAFYASQYFHAMRCQELPRGLDLMVADMGIHAGCHASGVCLQLALGMTADEVDGWIGRDTLALVAEKSNAYALIKLLSATQGAYYTTLDDYLTFKADFDRRLQERASLALSWVTPTKVTTAS